MAANSLPNAERAVVDLRKLAEYCLNPAHETGKHKARVFAAALGMDRSSAPFLRERLLEAAASEPAWQTAQNKFGALYVVDFRLTTAAGSAVIRSNWMIRLGEDFPRLITCYVKQAA
jgi:hypothetical protein